MDRIISFDEYLKKGYQRRLEIVKEWRELTSLDEARALGLSLDEYLENIDAILGLVGKNSAIDLDDLPPWAQTQISPQLRSRFEKEANVRCNNLNVICWGLGALYAVDNYGIVIVGNQENMRGNVEADLKDNPMISRAYEISEPNEIKNVGVNNFDDGTSIRSNGVQTAFNRKLERTAPIYEELESLQWSQVTREQASERDYQDRINPSAVFYVRHMNSDPDNLVVISTHGNELGVAEVIGIIAGYVKDEKLLAHFQAGIKPSPNWPGVLYDPRTSKE